jgi:hypothetical protein
MGHGMSRTRRRGDGSLPRDQIPGDRGTQTPGRATCPNCGEENATGRGQKIATGIGEPKTGSHMSFWVTRFHD